MATSAETSPTPFEWPSGPASVQVSGDWDGWKDKVDLDKQVDGTFSKKIHLPSNTKVQFKYIVDGQWTTNPSSPVVNTDGNQNNVVEVGPAPTAAETATIKAGEIGAGIVAGIGGAAAAAGAAASHFVEQVNGGGAERAEDTKEVKELSSAEKKAEPAAGLKSAADEDVRNYVPTSVTNATQGAMPVIASTVATVTGADIMRGNPESLPVSAKESNDTQAQALKGDNAALRSRLEPQGGAVSDPAAATTDNAKAAATVANSATSGAPVVPVTNNGFAANVTGDTGNLTTAADQDKVGREKAGAVAAASGGALGAAVAGGAAAKVAAKSNDLPLPAEQTLGAAVLPASSAPAATKPADQVKTETAAPGESKATSSVTTNKVVPSSAPIAAAAGSTTGSTTDGKMPTVGPTDNKVQADKATAPAAATSAPLAAGKETTTPAAAPVAARAPQKEKAVPSTPVKKPVPQAAPVGDSAVQKNGKIAKGSNASAAPAMKSTSGAANSKPANVSPATAKTSAAATSPTSSAPATPERKKKTGLFGKIKQALTPHGSPDK